MNQTKALFMGITAHWIECKSAGCWTLCSEVIAFKGIAGAHNGENLGHYFVGLCKWAGIVGNTSSKVSFLSSFKLFKLLILSQLYCITADNTSNNDTTYNYIEQALVSQKIYSFNADQHCLPCLAHVVNLTITEFMNVVTKITHVETTAAIWEFDPTLTQNQVLGSTLDVVVVVQTLAIKIQASGQWIAYFECLQKECGIDITLKIPLQSNVRWGTAGGMLARSYDLWMVRLNLFCWTTSLT